MFRLPFYGYPYNYSYYKYYNKPINNIQNSENKQENSITNSTIISNTINQNKNESQPIFELLGIKIYTDDLIIIGILYFLYQEKVKDEMLYIILILLLLS